MRGVTEPLRSDFCAKCVRMTSVYLCRTICCNGAQLVYEVCRLKAAPHRLANNGQNVSHASIDRLGLRITDIPLLGNGASIQCEVRGCTNIGTECHHWAPQSIWGGTANDWPMSLLCRDHHLEWHKRAKVATGG